jgi:argininosuccinate synthase
MVTGSIQMKLYKGNIFFDSVDDSIEKMPFSLYTDDGSMEAMGGYDHKDAEGFLNVLGVSAKNVGNRQLRDSI